MIILDQCSPELAELPFQNRSRFKFFQNKFRFVPSIEISLGPSTRKATQKCIRFDIGNYPVSAIDPVKEDKSRQTKPPPAIISVFRFPEVSLYKRKYSTVDFHTR